MTTLNEKKVTQSVTINSAIIVLLAFIVNNFFGENTVSENEIANIFTNIATLGGICGVIIGRIKASSKISLPKFLKK